MVEIILQFCYNRLEYDKVWMDELSHGNNQNYHLDSGINQKNSRTPFYFYLKLDFSNLLIFISCHQSLETTADTSI